MNSKVFRLEDFPKELPKECLFLTREWYECFKTYYIGKEIPAPFSNFSEKEVIDKGFLSIGNCYVLRVLDWSVFS